MLRKGPEDPSTCGPWDISPGILAVSQQRPRRRVCLPACLRTPKPTAGHDVYVTDWEGSGSLSRAGTPGHCQGGSLARERPGTLTNFGGSLVHRRAGRGSNRAFPVLAERGVGGTKSSNCSWRESQDRMLAFQTGRGMPKDGANEFFTRQK